jgi:hypothetical protein
MPTRSYLGPATLVIDLREEPVTVRLEDRRVADELREWGGEIRSCDALLWAAQAAKDVRLRVGDREAEIFIVNHAAMSGNAHVRGTGPAPF